MRENQKAQDRFSVKIKLLSATALLGLAIVSGTSVVSAQDSHIINPQPIYEYPLEDINPNGQPIIRPGDPRPPYNGNNPRGPQTIPEQQPNQSVQPNRINIPNPFSLAANTLGLDFALNFLGGEQSMNHWQQMWQNALLPAMKDMTAQWHTAVIDRTRNYGAAMDAQNMAEDQITQQRNEYEAYQRLAPSETACVVASGIAGGAGGGSGGSGPGGDGSTGGGSGGLAEAGHIGRAITRGLGETTTNDAMGRKGSASEYGPVADYAERFAIYAQHFCDPTMNGGVAGCTTSCPLILEPEALQACMQAEAEGRLENADISIENFLLKDTIDMSNEQERLASYAILRNLVMPSIYDPIPQSALNDFSGANSLVSRREVQSLKNMPIAVVSSMIGRRTAVPDSNTSETIRPIRERAGVAPEDISDKASFNETMLALTKERFYDAGYFAEISAANKEKIKQEQVAVDILTSIMLRQIYTLQEQLNGLMAARASIKHNAESYGNLVNRIGSASPVGSAATEE